MRLLLLFFLFLNSSYAFSFYKDNTISTYSPYIISITNIGIADFRNILKNSITMKKVGKKFLSLEKKLNKKIITEQSKI